MKDSHEQHKENYTHFGYEVLTSYRLRRQVDSILAYLEDVGEGEVRLKVKNHRYRFIDIPTSVPVDGDDPPHKTE